MIAAYWFCVAVGGLWTLASFAMGHLGADHGGDAGLDHGDVSFPIFSPTVIATFIAAFGGLGLLASSLLGAGQTAIHLPVALGGATAIALLMAMLLVRITRAVESNSNVSEHSLRGSEGEVITSIPTNGLGEIAYVAAGIRYTASARTIDGGPVASGTLVEIDRVDGGTLFVRPAAALPSRHS